MIALYILLAANAYCSLFGMINGWYPFSRPFVERITIGNVLILPGYFIGCLIGHVASQPISKLWGKEE